MTGPREKYREDVLPQWVKLIESFDRTAPSVEWRDIDQIIDVLNQVATIAPANHMFIPTGGGLDISGASRSHENGCIELHFRGWSHIVNPVKLTLENIDGDPEWSYFRLECGDLEPSGVYEDYDNDYGYEEVTEYAPNNYIDRGFYEQGEYGTDDDGNPKPLPTGARVVGRYWNGSYVIFSKVSAYNRDSTTYDARHHKMSAKDFRIYIENNAK